MGVSEMQRTENHTCVFISFSSLKVKPPYMTKLVKEPMLRVQLDEHGDLQEFEFVSKAALLQSSFTAKKAGSPVPQLMKLKRPDFTNDPSGELEFAITNMLSIVCRETEFGYEYSLVRKEKEKVIVRRKARRKQSERMKITEQFLFIAPKIDKKEAIKGHGKAVEQRTASIAIPDVSKKKTDFDIVNDNIVEMPNRTLNMREFEDVVFLGTVSLRFLGPGD